MNGLESPGLKPWGGRQPALDGVGPLLRLGVLRGDQPDQRDDLGRRHPQRAGDVFG